jgi:hypothetical protein
MPDTAFLIGREWESAKLENSGKLWCFHMVQREDCYEGWAAASPLKSTLGTPSIRFVLDPSPVARIDQTYWSRLSHEEQLPVVASSLHQHFLLDTVV